MAGPPCPVRRRPAAAALLSPTDRPPAGRRQPRKRPVALGGRRRQDQGRGGSTTAAAERGREMSIEPSVRQQTSPGSPPRPRTDPGFLPPAGAASRRRTISGSAAPDSRVARERHRRPRSGRSCSSTATVGETWSCRPTSNLLVGAAVRGPRSCRFATSSSLRPLVAAAGSRQLLGRVELGLIEQLAAADQADLAAPPASNWKRAGRPGAARPPVRVERDGTRSATSPPRRSSRTPGHAVTNLGGCTAGSTRPRGRPAARPSGARCPSRSTWSRPCACCTPQRGSRRGANVDGGAPGPGRREHGGAGGRV